MVTPAYGRDLQGAGQGPDGRCKNKKDALHFRRTGELEEKLLYRQHRGLGIRIAQERRNLPADSVDIQVDESRHPPSVHLEELEALRKGGCKRLYRNIARATTNGCAGLGQDQRRVGFQKSGISREQGCAEDREVLLASENITFKDR